MKKPFSILMVISFAICTVAFTRTTYAVEKPNIVVIYADDLGYGDVSSYNRERGKIATPHIDRLAAEGMRFTDGHSSSGVCSPSRYTLLTGRYHWRSRLQSGIVGLWGPPLIAPDRLTVAGLLSKAGYRTACIGKWHLGWNWPIPPTEKKLFRAAGREKDVTATDAHRAAWRTAFSRPIAGGPTTRGFDTYFGTDVPNWPPFCFIEDDRTIGIPSEFLPARLFKNNQASVQGPALADWALEPILPALGERASRFIERAAKEPKPFFLYMPLTSPHTPLAVNAPWKGKSGLNTYGDFVLETDAVVGTALTALAKSGAAEHTLVFFTSDNGCAPYIGVNELEKKGHYPSGPLRGYKSDVWEGGHRVPFIVRWPGVVKAGRVCKQLVHQADILATCADIIGASFPASAGEDSFSFFPLLKGDDRPIRTHAVSQSARGLLSVRRGQWKLIAGRGSGGWTKGQDEHPAQLYNLENDLGETRNLWAEEGAPVAELITLMEKIVTHGRSTPGPAQKNDVPVKWRRFFPKKMSPGKVGQRPPRPPKAPVDYVDPLLGTSDSRWMMFPGPTMPFGMVKLSPDNQGDVPGKVSWKAGHEYTVENITGFSHIHSWTMGGLLCMPTVGNLQTRPGLEKDPDRGYRSRYRHETEEATAGYYAVTLDDYRIRAELTATTRTGFHRYTFPASDNARILLDLEFPTEYGFKVLDAHIRKVSEREIEGFSQQRATSWAPWNEYVVHFSIRLSKPMDSLGGWIGDNVRHGVEELEGNGDIGAFVSFKTTAGEVIQMQVGISLVSTEQARLNRETEMAPFGWDFDAVRKNARNTWNELLSRIEVQGGSERDKIRFYSNLYRSYCGRTTWSDVNGKYVDMCEKVRQADSPVYGCDAFWNTFWNLNPLWALMTPGITRQWVDSLLEIYDRGGWLAKGPTGIEYSSIMVASHEIALIVGAYQKGIRDFDVSKAYEAMRKIQMTPGRPHPCGGRVGNRQLQPYMDLGYVPVEKGRVSNTLEYAYDDWCVAQMAKVLGKAEDFVYFQKRSRNYRNAFDRSVGYVRRRHADGRWVEEFSPFSGKGFVEGNAWQYTWFVPHDVYGLIDLMGREEFNRRLKNGFIESEPHRFHAAVYDGSIQRIEEYYINHGNQPNMQAAYLFNYSGKPWETQRWVRAILDKYYGIGPIDGYPGDEDQGQMGAWFVLSAMGLFQVDGGCSPRPVYEIGSPLFDRVVIHLDDRYYPGKSFVIETVDNAVDHVYIQSATLDGQPLNQPWFYHSDLVDGGKLVLRMGRAPNEKWGSSEESAPPSTF